MTGLAPKKHQRAREVSGGAQHHGPIPKLADQACTFTPQSLVREVSGVPDRRPADASSSARSSEGRVRLNMSWTTALRLLLLAATLLGAAARQGGRRTFTIEHDRFVRDGEPLQLISGRCAAARPCGAMPPAVAWGQLRHLEVVHIPSFAANAPWPARHPPARPPSLTLTLVLLTRCLFAQHALLPNPPRPLEGPPGARSCHG